MKHKFSNIVIAVLVGVSNPAIPYALFVIMVEKISDDYFHLHPQFVTIILGLVLLCLGGYMTGKILRKGKFNTLFHELTHSTGHESRLNRNEISNISLFESHNYSKEELVAEIGSAFLCGHCGIEPSVIENQAAYIQNWLKKLQSNKKWLVYAAGKAQKAADFILGVEHEKENSLPGGHLTGNSVNATPNE